MEPFEATRPPAIRPYHFCARCPGMKINVQVNECDRFTGCPGLFLLSRHSRWCHFCARFAPGFVPDVQRCLVRANGRQSAVGYRLSGVSGRLSAVLARCSGRHSAVGGRCSLLVGRFRSHEARRRSADVRKNRFLEFQKTGLNFGTEKGSAGTHLKR